MRQVSVTSAAHMRVGSLVAPIDGIVAEIAVVPDAQVAEGAKVMIIAPALKS